MTEHDRWLRSFGTASGEPAVRLVCLPHAGGAASYFYRLARAMGPEVDLLAVQYPGRQDRHAEPCVADAVVLAERLVEVLRPLDDRPMVVFGHSLGATVGFEAARRLEADSGFPLASLVVSARGAPSMHHSLGIHLLDDDGLIAEIRKLSGTQAGVLDDEELLRFVLPSIRADYQAAETYRYEPGPLLRAPVVGLCGDADPRVTPADVDGWRAHTTGGFTAHTLAGDHFYFGEQPADLAEVLTDTVAGVTPVRVDR